MKTTIFMDAFVLRFPGTGIVNMTRNVIARLRSDPRCDLTILLQDLHFHDAATQKFATANKFRLVEETGLERALMKFRRRTVDRDLAVNLPRPGMINRSTERCDVYHCTDWYYYPSRKAKKNVITVYDFTTVLFPQFHEATNIEKERRKAEQLARFDHVIAISENTKRDLVSLCGVDARKISVLPLGTDPVYESRQFIARDVLQSYYSIPAGRRYILSVSAIEPRKNIIGLLEAFRHFAESSPSDDDVMLVLAGPLGWKNEQLTDFLSSYSLRDRVIFTGYVATEDMPSLYHFAECFVYLSFYEGFGIPILEAMKSSCPVVCSNTSSMPEVIGDCGQLVSPHSPREAGDAIVTVLNNPALAEEQRRRGFDRSKDFTWDSFTNKLIDIYTM